MTQAIMLGNLYQEEIYRIAGKVIVVISRPWEEISLDDRILLSKILGSVKLTLSCVQVKVCHEFSLEDFKKHGPTSVISFGAQIPNISKKYEHLTIEDTSIVIADELSQLDEVKKRSLWLALKQIFQ